MPDLPQNIPLLHLLIRCYDRDKQAFLLDNFYLRLTVNEVAMILGLPNRGRVLKFARVVTVGSYTQ
ncbi:hypothetical protein KSP40_PGU007876 [Platanthera guangdongensis]|uniref:Uncharacterized protein n=1 Tax=Platanthera guangdongensis TaxID=2320717 RepID=A0ABR2LEA5_9ASPA